MERWPSLWAFLPKMGSPSPTISISLKPRLLASTISPPGGCCSQRPSCSRAKPSLSSALAGASHWQRADRQSGRCACSGHLAQRRKTWPRRRLRRRRYDHCTAGCDRPGGHAIDGRARGRRGHRKYRRSDLECSLEVPRPWRPNSDMRRDRRRSTASRPAPRLYTAITDLWVDPRQSRRTCGAARMVRARAPCPSNRRALPARQGSRSSFASGVGHAVRENSG